MSEEEDEEVKLNKKSTSKQPRDHSNLVHLQLLQFTKKCKHKKRDVICDLRSCIIIMVGTSERAVGKTALWSARVVGSEKSHITDSKELPGKSALN